LKNKYFNLGLSTFGLSSSVPEDSVSETEYSCPYIQKQNIDAGESFSLTSANQGNPIGHDFNNTF
jgi:hypothetical protein